MHVVIADDDPTYLRLVQSLLNEWRFEAVPVTNGRQAMAAVKSDPSIHLVILDWMMPEMDGFEACQRLKEQHGDDIYVILITGNHKEEEIMKVIVAGADDYILKPFTATTLKIRVRNAVRVLRLQAELHGLSAKGFNTVEAAS